MKVSSNSNSIGKHGGLRARFPLAQTRWASSERSHSLTESNGSPGDSTGADKPVGMPSAAALSPEVEARIQDVVGGTSTRELAEAVKMARNGDELFAVVDAVVRHQPARGHVRFINAVLSHMEELEADMEVHFYNRLLEVFPTANTYKTRSLLDAVWPRESLQVDAALKVLERMEFSGVVPNGHTFSTLFQVFGKASQPIKKVRRMGYWMRRVLHANPYSISLLPERPHNERTFMRYCAQRIGGETATCHEERVALQAPSSPSSPSVSPSSVVPEEDGDGRVGMWFTHTEEQRLQIAEFAKQGIRMRVTGPFETWTAGVRKRYLRLDAHVTTATRSRIEYVLGTCVAYDAALTDTITDDPRFYAQEVVWRRCAQAWAQHLQRTCAPVAEHHIAVAISPQHGQETEAVMEEVEVEAEVEVAGAREAQGEDTVSDTAGTKNTGV